MIVLRVIGGFFVKIGRWIKNTAWVQPLLIVGGLFAIIFSIPAITSWVQSWFKSGNEATAYYSNHAVSLSGADTGSSDVDQLLTYMKKPSSQATQDEKNRWGEKFFIAFVQDSCANCEAIYKGFQVLESEWYSNPEFTSTKPVGNTEEFKLYTIFIDSQDTINNEAKYLFKDYVFNTIDDELEDIMTVMQDCPYAKNGKDSNYQKDLETLNNVDSFATPTVFLFDRKYGNKTTLGVSEVLFTVKGKDNKSGMIPVARTLLDCWYHIDVFSEVIE